MHRKIIVPRGWPCTLEECPPGPFIMPEHPELLCFKSEYTHATKENPHDTRVMAFCETGEYFAKGNVTFVQPIEMIVEDDD